MAPCRPDITQVLSVRLPFKKERERERPLLLATRKINVDVLIRSLEPSGLVAACPLTVASDPSGVFVAFNE